MENKVLLGKYRVCLDPAGMPMELRRSAAGVTCLAQNVNSGKEVALELVPGSAFSGEMREQIDVEGIAAKQLNHVNIPTLYDFGWEDGDLVYVTEYFDGTTADAWITAHGPMPVRAVLHVALQVVSALGAATFHLLVHRAIHPGNILIASGQTNEGDWPLIKVLNFGRVLPRFRKSEQLRAVDKSAPFGSPEQVKDGTVDFRSEIYSLGCTLWSLLTGVSPFNAPGKPVAPAQMAPAMRRFRGVPKKIRRLITEMVSINPDERPLDPVVMTQQLQDCLLQVERREEFASRFGIPATWQRRRVARPRRAPIFLRPIAVAALLLGLATLTAPHTFWEKFTRRQPIGVPIGVPEASVAPASITAQPNEPASAPPSIEEANAPTVAENEASNSPSPPPPIVAAADQSSVTAPSSVPPASLTTEPNEPASTPAAINETNAPTVAANEASNAPSAAPPFVASANQDSATASPSVAPTGITTQPNEPASAPTAINEANAPTVAANEASNAFSPAPPLVASANQNSATASPSVAPAEQEEQTNNVTAAETAAAPTQPEPKSEVTPPAIVSNVPAANQTVRDTPLSEQESFSPSEQTERSATNAENSVSGAEIAASTTTPTPETKSMESTQPEQSPAVATKKVPRAELIEPPPSLRSQNSGSRKKPNPIASRKTKVPRAELVEPPPPAEGPDNDEEESATGNTPAASKSGKLGNVPRAELIEPPPTWTANASRERDERTAKTKRTPGKKRSAATISPETDGAMVKLPNGTMVHARFVGRTRDGQWMLALPSRRIMVVPPPPGFSSR